MQKTIGTKYMKLRKLEQKEHRKTRALWEDVFVEDTKQFLDYYYDVKTADNEILAMDDEDKIIAMLHLNPYNMRINDEIHPTNYIVAVATDEKYRKRGIMGQLLKQAMRMMHDRKEPFTFLMPAAEAIYYPYDFRYIYSRNQGEVFGENNGSDIEIIPAKVEDCGKLAEFANAYLKEFQVVSYRDEEYYQTLIAEQQSEAGEVMMIYKQGKLAGLFCYAKGEHFEIREPLFYEETDFLKAVYLLTQAEEEPVRCIGYGCKKQPIIMARILHLETFFKCIKLQSNVDVYVELQDDFIEENNGVFHIMGTAEEGITFVKKEMTASNECKKMSMGDFTVQIFGKYFPKVFLNEIV